MARHERPDKSGNSHPVVGGINLMAYPAGMVPFETRFSDAAYLHPKQPLSGVPREGKERQDRKGERSNEA